MQRITRLCVFKFYSLIILSGLIGCSSQHLPTAPQDAGNLSETLSTPAKPIRIGFISSQSPPALGKSTGPQSSSPIRTKRIGKAGGTITIVHQRTHTQFKVPRKALESRTAISMQVHGSGPSALVEFGPSGLQFNKPCTLSITFSSEGVDPQQLGGYLIHDDGSTTEVPYRIIVRKRTITLQIQVPHFSTYSGDDNEAGNSSDDDYSDVYDEDV